MVLLSGWIQFSGPYMENNIFISQRFDFQASFCWTIQEANSKWCLSLALFYSVLPFWLDMACFLTCGLYLISNQLLRHPWVIGDCAKQDLMHAEVVSNLQRFNARRKLRAAAIASVLSSKVALRTKRLRSLLGTHDLTSEELDNLRVHFARMWVQDSNRILLSPKYSV